MLVKPISRQDLKRKAYWLSEDNSTHPKSPKVNALQNLATYRVLCWTPKVR
jgi:hypothetical protein